MKRTSILQNEVSFVDDLTEVEYSLSPLIWMEVFDMSITWTAGEGPGGSNSPVPSQDAEDGPKYDRGRPGPFSFPC
jgi:hypothetical protein